MLYYLVIMLEFDPEKRKTNKLLAGLALALGAKMLGVSIAQAAQSVDCPIFMFHGIAPGGAAVDRVIRENARQGRIPVSVKQLSEIILGELDVPNKPLFAITFDDGLLNQYLYAKPVLDRYEAEATFFIMGGLMDGTWTGDKVHTYMTAEQVAYLSNLGYEIGSHTVTHSSLTTLYNQGRHATLYDEISHSKEKLEAVTDEEVVSFSYPNGSYNPSIVKVVSGVYKSAVSVLNDTRRQTPNNLYLLRRVRA